MTAATSASHDGLYRLRMLWPHFLVWLVWSITPISWFLILHASYRIFHDGADWRAFFLPAMPRVTSLSTLLARLGWGFVRVFMFLSIGEVPFSIYLYLLTLHASRIRPPPAFEIEKLETLLIDSLQVGLPRRNPKEARTQWHGKPRPLKKIANAYDERHLTPEATVEIRKGLMRWFHNVDISQVRADNVREWLAWAFLGRELSECRQDDKIMKLIEDSLGLLEKRTDWTFPPGHNSEIRSIRLTLDRLQAAHRPLGAYLVCNGFTYGTIAWACLLGGFQLQTHGEFRFLVRPATKRAQKSSQLPVVFLHGLGIGIGQYLIFLRKLARHETGVVIMLQPNISGLITSRHFLDAPTEDEHVSALKTAMNANGFETATLVSHSNGTMLHGWILRREPQLVARSVLVDPVSFRLWEGALCYNFLHKEANTPISVLLRYFVAQELSVAHTICRRFAWPSMALWVPEFPSIDSNDVHFIFGQNDILVDIPGSVDYLKEEGVQDDAITVMKGYQHGQALFLGGEGMRLACKYAHIPF